MPGTSTNSKKNNRKTKANRKTHSNKKKMKMHSKKARMWKGGLSKPKTKTKTHMKKINCNPAMKGKTVDDESCLTDDVLGQLNTSYNKNYVKNQITSSDPKQIWSDLKERMTTCDREDCWLEVVEDKSTREKIKKLLYAPYQPEEWKKKPDTWLSNFDIFDVLKQYEEIYPNFKIIGPTPIDFDSRPDDMDGECVWKELCTFSLDKYLKANPKKTKLGIVFNLDKHNKGGSHWVSAFIDLDDDFIFYLDSAGEKIPKQIDAFVNRVIEQGSKRSPPKHIHLHENCPVEHQMGTTECGMYSLYFIITMLTGETEGKVFKNYNEKISFFKDKRIPDEYVYKYRDIYFNE